MKGRKSNLQSLSSRHMKGKILYVRLDTLMGLVFHENSIWRASMLTFSLIKTKCLTQLKQHCICTQNELATYTILWQIFHEPGSIEVSA